MEIEKLIERLEAWNEQHLSVVCGNGHFACDYLCENEDCIVVRAATALEQLQAENDRLRRERDDAIRQLKFFAPCAGCKWYRGIKGCAHELGCDTNHDYYEFVAKEE